MVFPPLWGEEIADAHFNYDYRVTNAQQFGKRQKPMLGGGNSGYECIINMNLKVNMTKFIIFDITEELAILYDPSRNY